MIEAIAIVLLGLGVAILAGQWLHLHGRVKTVKQRLDELDREVGDTIDTCDVRWSRRREP